MKYSPLILALLISLAGCGGGGGGAPVPVNKLSGQMRQLQPGDSCTYTFRGTLTPINGSPTAVSGTAVNAVTARTGNQLTITHTVTTNAYGTSSTVTSTSVETQAADGSTTVVSVTRLGTSTLTAVSNTFISPGFLKVPLSVSGVVTYNNGETTANSFNVTGTQVVHTVLGYVNTFVVQGHSVDSGGYTSTTTSNLIPELGFAVGWSETDDLTGVGTESVVFALQSTTVQLAW